MSSRPGRDKKWHDVLAHTEQKEVERNGPVNPVDESPVGLLCRFVRHPVYSVFFLSAMGFVFLSADWCIAAIVALAFIHSDRVSLEEEMTIERIGEFL